MARIILPTLTILILALIFACKSSSSAQNSHTPPLLLSATKESWVAGHRSGGRGADFVLTLKVPAGSEYTWKSLESSGRSLALQADENSGDTITLRAAWHSGTDSKYEEEGVPEFLSGEIIYSRQNQEYRLKIPEFTVLKSIPRP